MAGCVSSGQGSRSKELPKVAHPSKITKRAREAIGLTARVMETAKPCRLRALGSAAVAQSGGVFFWLPPKNQPGMSFAELLMSLTSTILFSLSTWSSDPRGEMFSLCVCAAQVLLGSGGSLLI